MTYRDYFKDSEIARLVYAMVKLNEALIHSQVLKRIPRNSQNYEDLVSIGHGTAVGANAKPTGLIGAAFEYDPAQGRFSTFATYAIDNALNAAGKKQRHQLDGKPPPSTFDSETLHPVF